MTDYQDHPFSELFPLMGDAELKELADDIEANGLVEKIWLYEGKILDGRNRYRACKLKDIDPRIEEYKGRNPVGFVWSKNGPRRHLSQSQKAIAAAKMAGFTHGGDRKSDQAANLPLDRRDEIAAKVGVSERSVRDAAKVLKDGDPELVKAVESGKVTVSAAAEVAKLPKDEQRKAVADGTVKQTAAAKRKKKPKAEEKPEADADGHEEPKEETESPIDVFVGQANRLCRAMDAMKKDVATLAADRFGKHIHEPSITQHIEAARKALWQSRPTEPCNCAKAGGTPKPECRACFGCGVAPANRILKGSK